MVNVLYITDKIRQRSGITSVIMNYLENIPKENVKIDLLVYADSEESQIKRAETYGASIWFMPTLGIRSIRIFRSFMHSFFKEHRYDIVHSHFNQIDGIVFPIARKYGVKCCISHSHNTRLSDSTMKEIRNRLMCWNIRQNADILAACSEKAGAFLYGRTFMKSKKKLIINNGIDVKKYEFDPAKRKIIRREFGISDEEVLMGHIGRFEPQKNHNYLIKLFKLLVNKKIEAKLMLVGDGSLKGELEERAKEYGIDDRVIFTGVRNDVNYILSALDFFIFPSVYEGLGIVLIEAQCAGLKCFASDAVPNEVNVTGNVTFLHVDNNLDNWANAIINADQVAVPNRSSYAKIVGENGYDIIAEAKKLESIYITAAME